MEGAILAENKRTGEQMDLPYSLASYGISADVAIGLTLLHGVARRVDLIDEFSYIAIFLDCPEANHVFCVGVSDGARGADYFERLYLEPVISMAWRHGLPLKVYHRMPEDEWELYESTVKRQD